MQHGPDVVYEDFSEIVKDMTSTGVHPKKIKEGVLIPLQMPGKLHGSAENLLPIILLSMIHKVLQYHCDMEDRQ